MHRHRPSDESGFTLIEVLVALMILIVGLTGTFLLVDAANGRSSATKAREGATNVAREISEHVRVLPYTTLTPADLTPRLQAQPGIGDASPDAGWQIQRRNFTYTVTASVCVIDDRGDKFGDHSAGNFCADSATTGADDAQADDLKRVTIEVSFTDRGSTTTTRSVSTINSALQLSGVPVTALDLNRTESATTIAPSSTEPVVRFAVDRLIFRTKAPALGSCTSSATTCKIVWSVQGQRRLPEATRLGTTSEWEFTWTITGLSDGVYYVGAQTVDASGEVGPIREIPVRLARTAPPAVTDLAGGFNAVNVSGTPTEVAELQWSASQSLDVTGYRVLRGDGSTACETTRANQTTCMDFVAPAQTDSAALRTYQVSAIYYDGLGAKQFGASASKTVEPIVRSTTTTSTVATARKYRLSNGTANTGTNCLASTARRDLVDGVDQPWGYFIGGVNSITFCSPAFATGDAVAGPVTFSSYFDNNLKGPTKKCNVTAALSRRGSAATPLSSSTLTFTSASGSGTKSFAMPDIPATALAADDRLNLTLSFDQSNCSDVVLYYGLYLTTDFGGRLDLQTTSTVTTTGTADTRPDPPTNLTATAQGDGTVLLTWSKPAGGAPVAFYRIYKNGTDYTARLNTTGDGIRTTEEYTVPNDGASYSVTAVAPTLTESTFLGPVTP